jgi:undecaprenyl-diphosphatase
MNVLNAILLGLVQGVAEFLPISSSGHLALVENILGAQAVAEMDSSALFNILLHLATLVAVVIAYWQDVRAMAVEGVAMVKGLGKGQSLAQGNIPARRLILMIVIATLPLFIIVPFNDAIEKLNAMPWFIGLALIVTGTLLYIADRMSKGTKTEKNMTVTDALVIGAAQALATLPGLSRSGTTITAGMARGLDREFAVRFSFLMSLLSVLGAVVLKVISALGEPVDGTLIPAYLVGMVVAGVTGYLSIRLLNRLVVRKGRFGGFSYYCWTVGALSIVLSLVLK